MAELFWRDPRAISIPERGVAAPLVAAIRERGLCAVVMERGGETIGFLPFYVYRDVAKTETVVPLGVGTADYLDGVFAPECELRRSGGQ